MKELKNIMPNTTVEKIQNKKLLIVLIVFLAIIGSISIVSADDSSNGINIGSITSSTFDLSWEITGAGNSFMINEDGSASPGSSSKVNNDYNYTITIDISSLDDSAKEQLNHYSQSDEKKCELILNDGKSTIHFNASSEIIKTTVDGNILKIEGKASNTVNKPEFDFDSSEIIACQLTSSDAMKFHTDKFTSN